MTPVAHIDTETFPVTPETQIPRLVCLQSALATSDDLWREPGGQAQRDGRLVYGLSSFDLLGPVPIDEATEDDDLTEDTRVRREWPIDTHPLLLDADDAVDQFRWLIEETDYLICGVNVPFDLCVLLEHCKTRGLDLWRAVFEMLAAGRLRDTEVRQKLLNVARGVEMHKTGMEALARYWLGLDTGDDKRGPNSWRVRYRELAQWSNEDYFAWRRRVNASVDAAIDDVLANALRLPLDSVRAMRTRPVGTWPYHARRYALDDVIFDREIYRRQTDEARRLFNRPIIPDEIARPVARFCLHLQSTRGVLTDYHRACEANVSLGESCDVLMSVLVSAGLVNRKTIWTGGGVEPGAPVKREGDDRLYRFLARTTVKGVANANGRSGLIEEIDENEEPIGEPTIVELKTLTPASDKQGVKLSRNMAEIRKRVADTLLSLGYIDEGWSDDRAHAKKMLPITATGLIKTDRETMEIVASASDDPGLQCLAALSKAQKLQSTYVSALCVPRRVHWRYDPLKDTGRTSAGAQRFFAPNDEGVLIQIKEGTNVQNFPGEKALRRAAKEILKFSQEISLPLNAVEVWAEKHDPRAMIVASPGYMFSIHDYKAIELACMARVWNVLFKKPSTLANVINSGKDPHLYTGVRVHPTLWKEEITYEELARRRKEANAIEKANKIAMSEARNAGRAAQTKHLARELEQVLRTREMCKVVNFGFLGAMGAAKFVLYALLSYGVDVDHPLAKQLRKDFLRTYPEAPQYFEWIGERLAQDLPIIQIGSKRVRRGVTYAAACNSYFQGLAADGGMEALWRVTWAAFVDDQSPAYGARPVIWEHDCLVSEVPIATAQEAHDEIGRLMIEGMEVYLRDEKRPELSVRVDTDGALAERWVKG